MLRSDFVLVKLFLDFFVSTKGHTEILVINTNNIKLLSSVLKVILRFWSFMLKVILRFWS